MVAAVLSGNRNFEGRIHPLCGQATWHPRPSSSPSPSPAGSTSTCRPSHSASGTTAARASWGSLAFSRERSEDSRVRRSAASCSAPRMPRSSRAGRWSARPSPGRPLRWDPTRLMSRCRRSSSGMTMEPAGPILGRIKRLAPLRVGDSVTTDHISPAGSISASSPAGMAQEHGVPPPEFNNYGARRGHHEVMIRGTFGNIRLRNGLAGREGPFTVHLPDGADDDLRGGRAVPGRGRAPHHHRRQGIRLGIVARLGGQGAEAARRPGGHRRELRADPPLQPGRHGHPAAAVPPGESAATLGLTGHESYTDRMPAGGPAPGRTVDGTGRTRRGRRRRRAASRSRPGWTARSRSTTTARAASCRRSCGGSRGRRRGRRPRRVRRPRVRKRRPRAARLLGATGSTPSAVRGPSDARAAGRSAPAAAGRPSPAAMLASTFAALRMPGMIVLTSGLRQDEAQRHLGHGHACRHERLGARRHARPWPRGSPGTK